MENKHPIEGLMNGAMEHIRQLVDVNTIVGNPITTPDGTTVIPISKVAFGFGAGGNEFNAKPNVRRRQRRRSEHYAHCLSHGKQRANQTFARKICVNNGGQAH